MTGAGSWAGAFGKAKEMVGRMTLEEKVGHLPRTLRANAQPPLGLPDGVRIG